MTASTQSLARLVRWAEGDARIVAAALVGSHARGQATPDSDIDVVLLGDTQDAFFADTAWLTQLGVVVRRAEERWGRVRAARVWLDAGTRRVIEGGFRVLFDRAGAFAAIEPGIFTARRSAP